MPDMNENAETQQEYFGIHTDNKETLYNALKRIEALEKENGNLKAELTKVKQLLAFWVGDFYDSFNTADKYEERHKALVETEQFLEATE